MNAATKTSAKGMSLNRIVRNDLEALAVPVKSCGNRAMWLPASCARLWR